MAARSQLEQMREQRGLPPGVGRHGGSGSGTGRTGDHLRCERGFTSASASPQASAAGEHHWSLAALMDRGRARRGVPDNTPVQVLVAGDAWVLTRMDGVLTAFDDHCPHWQSPLSAGSVTRADDGSPRLSCAFHGWRFDAMGQCDLMPGLDRGGHAHRGGHRGGHRHQDWQGKHGSRGGYTDRGRRGPGTRLLAAYGVAERYGLVWLAADEPLAPLPEFPEWEDEHGRPCHLPQRHRPRQRRAAHRRLP